MTFSRMHFNGILKIHFFANDYLYEIITIATHPAHSRGLNPPHRVKSISMMSFTADEMDFLKARGNDVSMYFFYLDLKST